MTFSLMKMVSLTDPCMHVKCGHGEVCVVDGDRARCLCPPRCLDHRVQQVCGTDGITYKSNCELMRTACMIGDKTLAKKQNGRCGSIPPSTESPTSSPSISEPPTTGNIDLHVVYQLFLAFFLPCMASFTLKSDRKVY